MLCAAGCLCVPSPAFSPGVRVPPSTHLQETSLTEHFKELMREQSRIHQQLTEAAVKEAEQVCVCCL